jgi:hypothetical protein
MLRRQFIRFGVIGTIFRLSLGAQSPSNEVIGWGSPVADLALGLGIEAEKNVNALVAYLKNVGSNPFDLYTSNGEVARLKFLAQSSRGEVYQLQDRAIYSPCGGLCGFPPVIQRVESGATIKLAIAFDNLLYVPVNGPYATLATLFGRGFTVQASFKTAEEDLEQNKLSPEFPWAGEVQSRKLSKPSHA